MIEIETKADLYKVIDELRTDARNGRLVGFVKELRGCQDAHEKIRLLYFVSRNLEKKGYKLSNRCVAAFFK